MDEKVQGDQLQGDQSQGNKSLEPHRGTMILIFGIIGIIVCGIFAVLAWVFGNQDLKKMDSGIMDNSGRDTTNIGRILGIVGVCLWAAGIIIWIIMLVGFAGAAAL